MITKIDQFKKILEKEIKPTSELNQMSFWHGGNLDNLDDRQQKHGRWEYGPGLYLTTHYDVVQKYKKGSRKLYLVTVEKGNELSETYLDLNKYLEFVNKFCIKNKQNEIKQTINKILERTESNTINGETFLNIIINNDAISSKNTIQLKNFFIKNDIDYLLVDNAFGWHDKMLVLFNTDKIVNIERVESKDTIIEFNLPISKSFIN